MISSAIDVDTSVLETDFAIEKHETEGKKDYISGLYDYSTDLIKQEVTQFEFKMNQKMSLIGIDAIFVPQSWHVST